jgi:DNA-binding transcriptional ArsR family regulator
MEFKQQVIIRFCPKENPNADDIRRRLQDSSPMTLTGFEMSDADVSSSGKREKTFLRSDGRPINFLKTNILPALERQPFRSADSLAEVVGISYSTITRHLRDSL